MENQLKPLLSVQNLKTYFSSDEGLTKAVDGASFDILPGKTLAVVGESGCGKSVTARSILRIVERPGRIMDGRILLRRGLGADNQGDGDEIDLTKLDPDGKMMRSIRGKEIGLVFQEPMTSFSPVHTVGSQVTEAILLHQRVSKREAREKAIEQFRLVGIPKPERRVDEYAFELSGGLRQRAMIAMALSCDPNLLIADEPTTALDVTTQAQILDLLTHLQERRGMAIMLITHNLGVVAEMSDSVAVMYLGRVVEEGRVDDIFHSPAHPYTRALLRSIPSIHSVPRVKLPTISGSIPHPYNRPSGCPFHPRCPSSMPGICNQQEPSMVAVNNSQRASCFLFAGA
jgi:oligopeptide/dipeptide ABC transporter ATP-binding protein